MWKDQPEMYFMLLMMLMVISRVKMLKVFNFEDSVERTNISYLQLSNSPDLVLPDVFILCSSHIQKKIYDKPFYVLYDASDTPWFSVSIWESSGQISLWADVLYGIWYKLGIVNKPWTNFWIHICVEIDLKVGKISSSINGNSVFTLEAPKLAKQKGIGLHLKVGLSDHSWNIKEQFPDSVSNINIYHSTRDTGIKLMSSNPCTFARSGDYIAWDDMQWKSSKQCCNPPGIRS